MILVHRKYIPWDTPIPTQRPHLAILCLYDRPGLAGTLNHLWAPSSFPCNWPDGPHGAYLTCCAVYFTYFIYGECIVLLHISHADKLLSNFKPLTHQFRQGASPPRGRQGDSNLLEISQCLICLWNVLKLQNFQVLWRTLIADEKCWMMALGCLGVPQNCLPTWKRGVNRTQAILGLVVQSTNLVGVKPRVTGVTAAVLEESKGAELEEPKIVTVTTPASLTLRWESEKGLKEVYNVTGEGE